MGAEFAILTFASKPCAKARHIARYIPVGCRVGATAIIRTWMLIDYDQSVMGSFLRPPMPRYSQTGSSEQTHAARCMIQRRARDLRTAEAAHHADRWVVLGLSGVRSPARASRCETDSPMVVRVSVDSRSHRRTRDRSTRTNEPRAQQWNSAPHGPWNSVTSVYYR